MCFHNFFLIFFSAKQNGIPAVIEILWLMMAWKFFGRHIFNKICARMKSHLKPFKIHKALLFLEAKLKKIAVLRKWP